MLCGEKFFTEKTLFHHEVHEDHEEKLFWFFILRALRALRVLRGKKRVLSFFVPAVKKVLRSNPPIQY